MSKVKVAVVNTIGKVVSLDPEATKGATLGTNVYLPNGDVGTPATILDYLGVGGDGAFQHKDLGGLALGDDHPQYTMWQARETITGQWEYRRPIWGADGTAALPEYTFTADPNTGMYRLGADNFGFSTNGVRRLDMNATRIDFTPLMHGPQGDPTTPAYSFTDYPTTGMYIFPGHAPEKELGFGTGGVHRFDISSLGIDSTVPFRHEGGSAVAPGYNFWKTDGTTTNSGMYRSGTVDLGFSINSTLKLLLSATALTADVVVQGPTGNAGGPTYSFSGDPNTGMYWVSSDVLGFSAGGSLLLSVGAAAITGGVVFNGVTGFAATPTYSFTGDANTGMYEAGADILAFATGGTRRFGLGAAGEILDAAGSAGTAGQVPTSAGSGAAWAWGTGGGGGGSGGGVAYVNTSVPAGNTIANTVTETAFASTYTIPANQLQAGSVVRLKLFGVFGTDPVAPTLRLRVKAGSTTLIDTGAQLVTASLTNQGWALDGSFVCFTAGVSGTLESQGLAEFATSSAAGQLVNAENTAAITVNTTTTQALTVTVQWGTADPDNTITLREMAIELLDTVSPTTAAPATATYLTENNETATLTNSRRLIAGTNVTFNDATPGQRTISASGGGGGGTAATIRNSTLQTGSSNFYTLTFPVGSAVGDLAIITTNHAWAITVPTGWTALDNVAGTNVSGMVAYKVLDAGDLATGSVTINYSGSFDGVATLISFVTGTYTGVPLLLAANRTGGPLATYSFVAGMMASGPSLVTYGGTRANGAVTHLVGSTQQNVAGSNASAKLSTYQPSTTLYIGQTVSYAVSTDGTYTVGVIVNGT
jgi:hypothetical protein